MYNIMVVGKTLRNKIQSHCSLVLSSSSRGLIFFVTWSNGHPLGSITTRSPKGARLIKQSAFSLARDIFFAYGNLEMEVWFGAKYLWNFHIF